LGKSDPQNNKKKDRNFGSGFPRIIFSPDEPFPSSGIISYAVVFDFGFWRISTPDADWFLTRF